MSEKLKNRTCQVWPERYTEFMLSDSKLSEVVPGPREQKRQATRRLLLDAGLRMVAASGLAGTSTAAVAQATGKAHGTVFFHFPTREALVTELVAEVGRCLSDRLGLGEAPGLEDVLDAHLLSLGENELVYSRLLAEAATLPLAARATLFAFQSGVASRLVAALRAGQEKGTVRAGDPVFFSNLWIGLTNHYLLNRDLFAPGESVVARLGKHLRQQFSALVQP